MFGPVTIGPAMGDDGGQFTRQRGESANLAGIVGQLR